MGEVGVEIMPAGKEDLEVMVGLMKELADHHVGLDVSFEYNEGWEEIWREFVEEQIENDEDLVLKAVVEGKVVGFVSGVIGSRPVFRVARRGIIQNIVVRREYRGRGIGRRLVEAALAWFRERDVGQVDVDVAIANEGGVEFWKRLGFVPYMLQMKRMLEGEGRGRQK
ncbi:MAG TPA: GNAT family N-acetyltransferase [Armatimonadetes bacterium]|nr:GNAT family N-acetyltransferase [Armatimonadota bacterium]